VIQRAAKCSRKVKVQPPATTQTEIYRSKCHHTTKRNFEIFKATDFLAGDIVAAVATTGQGEFRHLEIP